MRHSPGIFSDSRFFPQPRSVFTGRARLCCVGLCLVSFSIARTSRAHEGMPRVVLIEDPGDVVILPRLRAELAGLGLDVKSVPRKDDERLPHDLIEAARSTSAMAAFRVVIDGERADVWIADRVTGKVVLREMLPRGTVMDGRVVALRAVELFRVSLVELQAPQAPQGELPPPPELTETPGLIEDPERLSLSADSSFLWSPGGTSASAGVAASLCWKSSWLGARLSGGSMLAPATITRIEGAGEVTTRWLGLDATLQPRRMNMRWRPRAGLGFAAVAADLRGVSDGLLPTSSYTLFTFAPKATADLGLAVHPHVRINLSVSYLRPLRSVDLVFVGNRVGRFGQDIFLANLGLDIVLP
jgi:hypothetical protein